MIFGDPENKTDLIGFYRYFLYDKNTNSTFTDLLEIDILEFKKVSEKDKSNLATWLRFLNTDDK